MLSFIRKRLPSKDQNSTHHLFKDDEQMKTFDSEKEQNNDEDKPKEQSSRTIDRLVVGPSLNRLNQSYSDKDYFPMASGGLAEVVHNEKLSRSSDSLDDCYMSPSDVRQVKNEPFSLHSQTNHMQAPANHSSVIDRLVTIIQKDSEQTINKRS